MIISSKGARALKAQRLAQWHPYSLKWSEQLIDGKTYKVFMRRIVDGIPQCRPMTDQEFADWSNSNDHR